MKLRTSDTVQLDEARGSTSRSEWVRSLILRNLGNSVPVSKEDARLVQAVPDADLDAARRHTGARTAKCPHPRARRSKGLCMACGTGGLTP